MDFTLAKKPRIPRIKQDRIILHIVSLSDFFFKKKQPSPSTDRLSLPQDYDCFYAQVIENAQPALKSLPLGIKQKGILATCNYVARSRGVKKLQNIADAKKLCPDLVLADGEDLSPFRDVSKRLYGLLRSFSWNDKVERLGMDETFLDVTDMIAYNYELLNRNALSHSYFQLSRDDPEKGFNFDATTIAGCVSGDDPGETSHESPLYTRLLLASHLARYLRLKVEEEGYTSACGIATNKLLSKMAGSIHKPRNQTTLLSLHEVDVAEFMDPHALRQVPGIGAKLTHALEGFYLAHDVDTTEATSKSCVAVTVGQLRTHPKTSPQLFEKLLGSRSGFEKGIGERIWALLHGNDDSAVKAASGVPTQISIEDTYPGANGGLQTIEQVAHELLKLSTSLLRRMYVDLTVTQCEELDDDQKVSLVLDRQTLRHRRKWLAQPKTVRLSTRPKSAPSDGKSYNWGRASRSQMLPSFMLSSASKAEDAAALKRLVEETLLPMFFALHPSKSEWNISMINICVTNMVSTAAGQVPNANGRDILHMLRTQESVLRDFRVQDAHNGEELSSMHSNADSVDQEEMECETWEDTDRIHVCGRCGHSIPHFAKAAHERYHSFEDL